MVISQIVGFSEGCGVTECLRMMKVAIFALRDYKVVLVSYEKSGTLSIYVFNHRILSYIQHSLDNTNYLIVNWVGMKVHLTKYHN